MTDKESGRTFFDVAWKTGVLVAALGGAGTAAEVGFTTGDPVLAMRAGAAYEALAFSVWMLGWIAKNLTPAQKNNEKVQGVIRDLTGNIF